MASVAAGTLQQFHSRLAAPSALWTTERGFASAPSSPTSPSKGLSCSGFKSPLDFQVSSPLSSPLSSPSSPRSRHFGSGSCAASTSTMEPPALYTQAKANKPTTLYDVLGISAMVTDDEIKAAFRRIAKEVHPDQAPPDQVTEYQKKFMEAHKAYSVLKDPRTRSLYNYEIRNAMFSKPQFRAEDWRRPMWRGCNWETDQCWTC